MSGWLNKQRKSDLVSLADEAGLTRDEGWLKDELVQALDDHLRANATSLAKKPSFSDFYQRTGSPIKGATKVPVPDDGAEIKPRKRRQTKVKEEIDALDSNPSSPTTALATRTPRAVQRLAARVPLPPSPAVITDRIERQTAALGRRVSALYERTGATEAVENLREQASTVVGIIIAALLVEATGLQRETLPWRYAFDLPSVRLAGINSRPLYLPDFFVLLTPAFWSASLLWVSTSLLLPLAASYFVNLTKKHTGMRTRSRADEEWRFDPLVFNVAKALVSYLVYAKHLTLFGLTSEETIVRVDTAVFGNYQGILIGAAIGGLTSLYDAVLKK